MLHKRILDDGLTTKDKLWRYYDIHKFISFLATKSIYFGRMDNMEDLNEGISMDQLQLKYGDENEQETVRVRKVNASSRELRLSKRQQKYFVSCWLLHNRESVAMWNLYSSSTGVAVGINGNELIAHIMQKSQFTNDEEKFNYLFAGKIVYKDFFNKNDRKSFKDETGTMGFHKDICFEHEKEYRFLLKQDLHNHKEDKIIGTSLKLRQFSKLPIEVVFHPKMAKWQQDNIKRLIKEFDLTNIKCRISELALK
jgi:hypothetical protein